jgi:hypothetical protein
MSAQVQILGKTVTRYASATDYYRIFVEEMESLYFLAYLLTADSDMAEQCFVGGLRECTNRTGVSMERARNWARRAIVKHAIQMIGPAPEEGANGPIAASKSASPGANNPFAFIISLCAFERFVFVMSVLEGQPDEDCQSLLRCSRQEVMTARKDALRLFGAANPRFACDQEGLFTWPRLLN